MDTADGMEQRNRTSGCNRQPQPCLRLQLDWPLGDTRDPRRDDQDDDILFLNVQSALDRDLS